MKDTYKINIEKNKSLTYMLPIIHDKIGLDFQQFLVNSYLSFDGDDTFCVMYKWSSDPQFLKYEGKLMNHPLCVGHTDYGNTVVYRFQLTLEMKRERELFVNGQYSSFSDHHKKSILDYMKLRGFNNFSRIARILDKKDSLSSDPPNMDLETLDKHVSKLVIKTENPWKE